MRSATLWVLLWTTLSTVAGGVSFSWPSAIDTNFPSGGSSAKPFGDLTSRYRILQWKVEQGLPQNHVSALLQSHDGYIWIGTIFGLVRYNGIRFTVFEKSTLPLMDLTDHHVQALAEDKEHALWVCTSEGLLRSFDHTWTAFQAGVGDLVDQHPTAVYPHHEKGVWVGASEHLLHFTADGLNKKFKIPVPGVRSIRMITEDDHHQVWFADRYRVMRWSPKSPLSDISVVFTGGDLWVRYLNRDSRGRVCFGGDFGSFRMEEGVPVRLTGFTPREDGKPRSELFGIVTDAKGNHWMARDGRLAQVRLRTGMDPEILGVVDHPGLTTVERIMPDNEGNLWVGTTFDGLLFLQERRFTTLQTSNNRDQNNIWTVCEDKNRNIWFGTSQNLFRWNDGNLTHFLSPAKDEASQVFTVWPDPDGALWVGYGGIGLYRLKDDRWEEGPITSPLRNFPLTDYNVRSLLVDREGALWFGMKKGVYHYKNDVLKCYTPEQGLPGGDIRAIAEDRKGVFWFGSVTNGLARYVGGEFNRLSKKDGLADNQISCFCEDSQGNMWIGTGSGLTRYKNGVLRTLRVHPEHLYDNVINNLLLDDNGFFWASCNRGIFRFSEKDANEVADGVQATLMCMPFGESDGMASAETNGSSQPSGWKGSDGVLWFPSTKGLVRIDPQRIQGNLRSPQVVIEQVIANQKIQYGDGMSLSPNANPATSKQAWREPVRAEGEPLNLKFPAGGARVLEIRYTANSFEEPAKVRFKFMLKGHDRDWQEPGDRRITHYTNLDPGDYEFLVQACNNHGRWGPINKALTFNVAPFFYQTGWFATLCALAVIGVAAAVQSYRLSIQRRILQLEKEHALEKERARIAKDVHDDLGARLTQLGMISELVESPGFRPGENGVRLPKVSSLARDAVRSLDEIVWAVSPGKNALDQLAGYIAQCAQDLLSVRGMSFDLQMPSFVPPTPLSSELRHNVFLVAKEALNNAVKHSKATRVRLEFTLDTHHATFSVGDNGQGFDAAEAFGSGNGLSNMQKRAESVGAHLRLSSTPGQGTVVVIRFPIQS